MNLYTLNKYKKLVLSLVFDVIGMLTFLDIIWAPLSGYLMTKMYRGQEGRVAGILSVLEEIIPGLDIIPTFTMMWFYTYVIKNESPQSAEIN